MTQSALLPSIAAQAPIVQRLTYVLLASGTHFRRKLVQFVGPSLARKKETVRNPDEIDMGVMTWLQGRFARVHTAVLFIALLFFGWLWGVAGLLLGAPLVAIVKVVCDRVESLKLVGELLGR